MRRGITKHLQYIDRMSTPCMALAVGLVVLSAVSAGAQEKGGEDETAAYEVAAGWPQPWSASGYTWGSQPAVFAHAPSTAGDRTKLLVPLK